MSAPADTTEGENIWPLPMSLSAHVHVQLGNGQVYRIVLLAGEFIGTTPRRGIRKKIMKAYYENIESIWAG